MDGILDDATRASGAVAASETRMLDKPRVDDVAVAS
jgi:hypothetical protein